MRKDALPNARALPSRSRDLTLYRQNGSGAGRLLPPAIPAPQSALEFQSWRALSSAPVVAL